jgi:hypothetical protein
MNDAEFMDLMKQKYPVGRDILASMLDISTNAFNRGMMSGIELALRLKSFGESDDDVRRSANNIITTVEAERQSLQAQQAAHQKCLEEAMGSK